MSLYKRYVNICDKYSIPRWLQRQGINIYVCDRGLVGVSIGVCVCVTRVKREYEYTTVRRSNIL